MNIHLRKFSKNIKHFAKILPFKSIGQPYNRVNLCKPSRKGGTLSVSSLSRDSKSCSRCKVRHFSWHLQRKNHNMKGDFPEKIIGKSPHIEVKNNRQEFRRIACRFSIVLFCEINQDAEHLAGILTPPAHGVECLFRFDDSCNQAINDRRGA